MTTQANSISTMPAIGHGVAALGLCAVHQGAQHAKPSGAMLSKPQSVRGSSFIANLLSTTASFWAGEYEDGRSPGGASA